MARSSRGSLFVYLALAALALLAIGIGVSFTSSASNPAADRPTGPAGPCPFGFVDRTAGGDAILARLAQIEETAADVERLRGVELRFCFGDVDVPVVTEGRVLLVDDRVSAAEQTARAGHLVHHLARGMPFPDEVAADADCDAIVERALAAEARAYALEVSLRRRLELPARYEFEADLVRVDEARALEVIAAYLRAHPNGAPHLEPLLAGYRQRCEVERAEAARGR